MRSSPFGENGHKTFRKTGRLFRWFIVERTPRLETPTGEVPEAAVLIDFIGRSLIYQLVSLRRSAYQVYALDPVIYIFV